MVMQCIWEKNVKRGENRRERAKMILQSTVIGKRRRGRQRVRWEDYIKDLTGMYFASLTRAAEKGLL